MTSPHRCIEFLRLVVEHKGQGVGRVALRLVKRLAFEEWKAHRLWLDVKTHNHRAQELYRSEGFREEGLLRECLRVGDQYESLLILAMLESEYHSNMTEQSSVGGGVGQAYLVASRHRLTESVKKIKHCLDQLTEEQVWWRPHEAQNSIANLVLHLCGNVRQWIVSGVGGTPDARDRPKEFSERKAIPKAELLRRLDEVAAQADAALARLTDRELLERRRIQGFDETALSAIYDSVTHFQGHTQEIVFITRLQLGDTYKFQWVPTTKEQGAL